MALVVPLKAFTCLYAWRISIFKRIASFVQNVEEMRINDSFAAAVFLNKIHSTFMGTILNKVSTVGFMISAVLSFGTVKCWNSFQIVFS